MVACAAILFLSDIWAYKEFVRAESYFGLGARLMVEQGEWLTPHAPDEQPLNKPPLTYWSIGIAYKLFGANYGSARLPSVLAGLLLLAIVYALGVRLYGRKAGLISATMLATSYLFMSFARMAMSDMLLTLFVTASMASIIFGTSVSERASKLVLVGYALLALGVLTKGPVAVALVAIPIGFELIFSRSREDFKKLRIIPGLVLFLLISAPYFVVVYARFGAAPLRFFFLGENLQRFTGQIYGASGRPFWYELLGFFGDFAPWSLLIVVAAIVDWLARQSDSSRIRAKRILYLWLGSTILLFSLSSFKLDYYLLPAMPASALILAPMIANTEALGVLARRVLQSFFVLCSGLVIFVAIVSIKAAGLLNVGAVVRFLPLCVASAGAIVMGVYFFKRKLWAASIVLCAAIGATTLSMHVALLPAFSRYLPTAHLASTVPANRVWHTSWTASDWANDLAFNLPPPHRVERLIGDSNNERLLDVLKNDQRAVAVIWEREFANLGERDHSLRIFSEAETFGRGGVTFKMLRQPKRERLLIIGHDR